MCHCKTARGDILLFLLVHLVLSSRTGDDSVSLPNPWTEYVKFLPEEVPSPTMWTEAERSLLRGTSLEVRCILSLRLHRYLSLPWVGRNGKPRHEI